MNRRKFFTLFASKLSALGTGWDVKSAVWLNGMAINYNTEKFWRNA